MNCKKNLLGIISCMCLFTAQSAVAFCPVCTLAVAGGVGLSRWLGVDDIIAGLWIGGVTVAVIIWTLEWFKKRNIRFFAQRIITIVFYYALVVWPLWSGDIIGHPLNTLWGVDKLAMGIFLGSATFFLGGMLHFKLKKENGDKVYFPFQKVVFAISPLIILNAVFYLIVK